MGIKLSKTAFMLYILHLVFSHSGKDLKAIQKSGKNQ